MTARLLRAALLLLSGAIGGYVAIVVTVAIATAI